MSRVSPLSTDNRALAGKWSRRQLLAAGGAVATALLAACRSGAMPTPTSPAVDVTVPDVATATVPPVTLEAEPELSRVDPDLRRKLAQMVLIGFRGLMLDMDNPIVEGIRDLAIGGVVLFSYDVARQSPIRNIESAQQVAALNAALADLAATPLLIAVDQEGGLVARLGEQHGFPATRAPQELGAGNDPVFTYAATLEMARTLAEAGFTHNFAPVVDVNTNPDNPVIGMLGRSFSADPAVVTEQAAAFIRAHRDMGITTTLKHFPGHGSSREDSHLGFVDVTDSWQAMELEPYRDLIDQNLVDSVMTAHVFNGRLDADAVATLSKPILTGILREQLGFDGVIFSDDMQMSAIADNYGFAEAVVDAVDAGVDVIAVGNNLQYDPNVAARIVEILAAAVMTGRISEATVDASYRRIMALKAKSTAAGPTRVVDI